MKTLIVMRHAKSDWSVAGQEDFDRVLNKRGRGDLARMGRAIASGTTWERRLEILNDLSDILDQKMVALGIIPRHPCFKGSETSGYRLLEHAYGAIVKSLPAENKTHLPRWAPTCSSPCRLPANGWLGCSPLTP